MDIVVMPVWRRPELLALALEALRKARGIEEHIVMLRLDEGHDPENRDVIAACGLNTNVAEVSLRLAPTDTLNTIEGYAHAARLAPNVGAKLIYLLQEDVMVAADFFEFHRGCHARFEPFAVSACPFPKYIRARGGPEVVSPSKRYNPWAVSLPVATVQNFIVPHALPDYYGGQLGYLERTFPNTIYGHGHGEQDYLIENIMIRFDGRCIVPAVPRAFHAGWWDNRRDAWHPRGSDLNDRIRGCREILATPAKLDKITSRISPMDLTGYNVKGADWKLVP